MEKHPLLSRVGRFEIPIDLINYRPDVVRRITGDCVIVRAESLFQRSVIEYCGYCEAFDEETGLVHVPEYDIEYDENTDTVTWTRKEA